MPGIPEAQVETKSQIFPYQNHLKNMKSYRIPYIPTYIPLESKSNPQNSPKKNRQHTQVTISECCQGSTAEVPRDLVHPWVDQQLASKKHIFCAASVFMISLHTWWLFFVQKKHQISPDSLVFKHVSSSGTTRYLHCFRTQYSGVTLHLHSVTHWSGTIIGAVVLAPAAQEKRCG